jgi:UPF0176 protein
MVGINEQVHWKNFVLITSGRKVTDDIVPNAIVVAPCDVHTNCANEGCHLLFLSMRSLLAATMEGCCSNACVDIIHLPEKSKSGSQRNKNGNMIFKKNQMF